MAKDYTPPVAGHQKFKFLSLVALEHFDALGSSDAVKADAKLPHGILVDDIVKVSGGFEVSYVAQTPKNRMEPSAGKDEERITRFIPFSFIKSAKVKEA